MTHNKFYKTMTTYRKTTIWKFTLMLLMMTIGVVEAWADGFEGIWYIANDNSSDGHPEDIYSLATDAKKWYLVPAANPQQLPNCIDAYYSPNHLTTNGDPEKPFLTTYQTSKDLNSIWIITASGETGYYFVIHALTGKYVVYEPPLPNDNNKRKTMHLQEIDNNTNNPTNSSTNAKFKFAITSSNNLTTGNINIYPKSRSGWYWNPAGQNSNFYYGQQSKESTDLYRNGIVGVYNNTGTNSIWHFEDASSQVCAIPTITYNESNGQMSISTTTDGATIYYTTDGTIPTSSSNEYTAPFTVSSSAVIKAIAIKDGKINSTIASKRVVKYTYNIVNSSNKIALQYSIPYPVSSDGTLNGYNSIPETIRSSYISDEEVTFYSFAGEYSVGNIIDESVFDAVDPISQTPADNTNIYVRYSTTKLGNKYLHLQGARPMNLKEVNGTDYNYYKELLYRHQVHP